ncbi:hypothetical protein BpHYR1_033448 [Brachionus plicatilis]|uniref:Uncharacterized protein n=1 Tax=Brachionus plicatilis TaxID=10195 RepID=A0A3M7PXB3_BRAPC|nr:hypothetical protein BpHYR1_033448 [Brachionus plicatilis]
MRCALILNLNLICIFYEPFFSLSISFSFLFHSNIPKAKIDFSQLRLHRHSYNVQVLSCQSSLFNFTLLMNLLSKTNWSKSCFIFDYLTVQERKKKNSELKSCFIFIHHWTEERVLLVLILFCNFPTFNSIQHDLGGHVNFDTIKKNIQNAKLIHSNILCTINILILQKSAINLQNSENFEIGYYVKNRIRLKEGGTEDVSVATIYRTFPICQNGTLSNNSSQIIFLEL